MATIIKFDKEDYQIYAGNEVKGGKLGSNTSQVTKAAILAVFKHIVNLKMSGDGEETLELTNPIYKYGSKRYRVEVTLIPES